MTTIGKVYGTIVEKWLQERKRDTSGDGKSGRLRDPEQPVTTGTATASSCDRHHIHCVSFATVAAALLSHWPQKLNRWKNLFWKKSCSDNRLFISLELTVWHSATHTHTVVGLPLLIGVELVYNAQLGLVSQKQEQCQSQSEMNIYSCKVMRRSGWVFRSSFWCDSCVCVCRNVRLPRMTQGCLASERSSADSLNFLVVHLKEKEK